MNKTKSINELNAIFKATDEARKSILKSFPYNKMTIAFVKKLKILLSEIFKENISFDREEKFACIHGTYKGVNFEINVWCGIILTIEDEKKAKIIEDFKPIFNQIIGHNPICSYDYCTCIKTIYPTIEWNLHPEDRIYELVNMAEKELGCYKKNFKDFHTKAIIDSLEEKLLTQEGYNTIFETKKNNIKYHFYKIRLIQTLRPDIDNNTLYEWIDTSQAYNEMQKQLVKE